MSGNWLDSKFWDCETAAARRQHRSSYRDKLCMWDGAERCKAFVTHVFALSGHVAQPFPYDSSSRSNRLLKLKSINNPAGCGTLCFSNYYTITS